MDKPDLAYAFATHEGYFIPGSRANRNNNPGNIEFGPFARSHGADRIESLNPPRVPRFAHFPTAEQGWKALRALLLEHYSGLEVKDAIMKYAPPAENNVTAYVQDVCNQVHCQPTSLVKDVINEV